MTVIQRVVARVVIGSFSLAALLGIVALLGGGAFGDTEARILGTTVTVGVECVAVLTYLAAARVGRTSVAAAGGAASLVATAIVLYFVWGGNEPGDALWQVAGTALVLALTLAQLSLLLATTGGRVGGERLLQATAGLAAVTALMIVLPIWEVATSDAYWRLFGVLAILDVLGTIVVAVTRRRPAGPDEPASTLSPDARRRLEHAARERGVTPDELVDELLT
jgi:hypothetical protein